MKKIIRIAWITSFLLGMLGFGLIYIGNMKGAVQAIDILKDRYHEIRDYIDSFIKDDPDTPENEFWEDVTDYPSDAEFGIEEWSFSEKITKIQIDTEYSTVHILTAEDIDDIEVFGQKGSESDKITVVCEDGVLKVEEAESGINTEPLDNSYIRIMIPVNAELEAISIESDAGLISYAVETELDSFSCHIDAGELMAEQIYSKNGEISVDAGNIDINCCYMESATLTCDVGNIQLSEMNVTQEMTVECTTGNVDIELEGDILDYGFSIENSLGTVKIAGEIVEGENVYYNDFSSADIKIYITCDVGTIKIEFHEGTVM